MVAAFNLPEAFAEELRFRREQMTAITKIVKREKVTHAALANEVGTSRPRITALINNGGIGASVDLMIRVLNALGYQAGLKIKKTAS